MAKKRPPPKEESCPIWMATYADLMSLLLCFFVMLFSMSVIAEVKWEALVETLQKDFGSYAGSSRVRTPGRSAATSTSTSERSRRTAALTGGQPIVGPQGPAANVVSIRLTGEVVKGGLILFDMGNDELTEQAKSDLKKLFPILAGSPYKIMLRGHASPTEIGKIFKEDIDLAFARAVHVRKYLVSLGLEKEFFEINVVDSSSPPNRAVLPAGTAPNRAGASVEVMLLDQTGRLLKENQGQWTKDTPVQ